MNSKNRLILILVLALAVPIIAMVILSHNKAEEVAATPVRPEGPCDIYADGGTPCVTAHSTTRALSASYNGPLYQVTRQSDGETFDVGIVPPSAGDAGGYADAAAQDLAEYAIYVCGPPEMMEKVYRTVLRMGAREDKLYSERFWL